jgi:hypothetical protein
MSTELQQLEERLPVRARVALALTIADSTLGALAANHQASSAARAAMNDAWAWQRGEDVPAQRIHDQCHAVDLMAQTATGAEQAALSAVASALWYTDWNAYDEELLRGKTDDSSVPNDIAEGPEDVLDELCRYAARTGQHSEEWQRSLLRQFLADYGSSPPDTTQPREARQASCRLTREELIEIIQLSLVGGSVPKPDVDRDIDLLDRSVSLPGLMNMIFFSRPRMTPEEIADQAVAYEPTPLPPSSLRER